MSPGNGLPPSPDEASRSGTFRAIFPSLAIPMFIATSDQTIVATALPTIAAELGEVDRLSWVMVSYLVALTITAPAYGRLGDLLGRRRVLVAALAVLMLASVICACSTSMNMLIAGRALQGVGGGGLMIMAQALLAETIAPRERSRYQGYLAAVGVSSSTFGPVAGGFLTQSFGWPFIFLVNVPIGLAALALALRVAPDGGSRKPIQFDYAGLALFAAFVLAVLLALDQAKPPGASDLTVELTLAAVGVAALILLIRRERRASAPLLPAQLFVNPSIWRSNVLTACHGAVVVSTVTFLPVYLTVVRGTSPAETGLLLLPMTVGIGVGSLVTGKIVSRTGRTAIFPSCALIGVALILLALAFGIGGLSEVAISWLCGLNAALLGTVMGVVHITVQMAAERSAIGSAAAGVQLSRALGATLGTAAVGAVLFTALASADDRTASLIAMMLQEGPTALEELSGAARASVDAEIAAAFRAAFLAIAGLAAIGSALAWSIPLRRI